MSSICPYLCMKYYKNAIEKYDKKGTVFIIFSDDIEYVRERFREIEGIEYEIEEDEDDERSMWKMSECEDGRVR